MQKLIIILVLIVILGSLASAWYFMIKDKSGDSDRMLKALTWRIGLSVGLFMFLMLSYYVGWLKPNTNLPY